MSNQISLIVFLLLLANLSIAQIPTNNNICGFDQLQQNLLANDPAYKAKVEAAEKNYVEAMNNKAVARNNNVVYTLPTVIHIIHGGASIDTQNNPSDITIKEIIKHTNDRFRHASGLSFSNSFSGVDTQIELCLASLSTSGGNTSGIIRYNRPDIATNATPTQFENFVNQNRWDVSKYYNIYIFSDISTDIFPETADAAYNSIIDVTFFKANAFWSSGLLVHETGHYLSLAHTFQPTFSFNNDGCSNFNCLTSGDKVCDTPPKAQPGFPNSDCNITSNSCTTDGSDFSSNNPYRSTLFGGIGDQPDMRENYMDYSGYCWAAFSQGQNARMRNHITSNKMSLVNYATTACNNSIPANVCTNPPINLSNSNISGTSMTLNWSPVANATAYQVTYKAQNAINWTTINTTNAVTYTITNLSTNTIYAWRVRALCSTGFYSDWSFFEGIPSSTCARPSSVSSTRLNENITLQWTAVSTASTYELQYRPTGTSSWQAINDLTDNSYAITATLQPSTTYEWQVRTQCTNETTSDWSTGTFTTSATAACSKPSFSGSTTGNGGVNLSWESVATATSYQLRYRIQGTSNWSTTYNTTTTTYTPTEGLTASTVYEWEVRSVCNTLLSDWRAGTFTTSSSSGTSCTGTNITVQNTITNGNYIASNSINATCIINTNGTITMQAANSILLTNGFHAKSGASFTASIASCNTINQEVSIPTESSIQGITSITTNLKHQAILKVIPNPFQHKTTIRFYLPKESRVQISIMNLNGQIVTQQKIRGNQGWSSTPLDASQLPAGMYYTVLQTATQQLTAKIMVLR